MSSLIHCFAAIAEELDKKQKFISQIPPPLTDILVKYVFELRISTTGGKMFYQHTVTLQKGFNVQERRA